MKCNLTIDDSPISDVIARIVQLNTDIAQFWGGSHGWAPIDAAELLSKSRLDWQVELSRTLELWTETAASDVANARLILAWANLGALVEGTLKWFLSVYYENYKEDVHAIRHGRTGNLLDPDGLTLEPLRHFFEKSIWTSNDSWNDWIRHIQERRNAIHAYKDRHLGDQPEFVKDVRTYLGLLMHLESCVPYPDFQY